MTIDISVYKSKICSKCSIKRNIATLQLPNRDSSYFAPMRYIYMTSHFITMYHQRFYDVIAVNKYIKNNVVYISWSLYSEHIITHYIMLNLKPCSSCQRVKSKLKYSSMFTYRLVLHYSRVVPLGEKSILWLICYAKPFLNSFPCI